MYIVVTSVSPHAKSSLTAFSTVAKALEMFMQSLVENACDYAQSRNAKTMTCGHLYHS